MAVQIRLTYGCKRVFSEDTADKCKILWYSPDHCLWRTFSRSVRSGNHLLMCSISLFSGQFITTTRKVTTRRPTTGYYPFILSFLYSITITHRLSFHRDRPEALFPFKFHPVRNYNCAKAGFPAKTHVVVKGNHDLVPSFLWTWSYWIWNDTVWSANTLKHQDFTSKLSLCFFLKFSVLNFFFYGEIDGHINEANKKNSSLL